MHKRIVSPIFKRPNMAVDADASFAVRHQKSTTDLWDPLRGGVRAWRVWRTGSHALTVSRAEGGEWSVGQPSALDPSEACPSAHECWSDSATALGAQLCWNELMTLPRSHSLLTKKKKGHIPFDQKTINQKQKQKRVTYSFTFLKCLWACSYFVPSKDEINVLA